MIVPTKKTYYDDCDTEYRIKLFSRNKSTNTHFNTIYKYFFNDHAKSITSNECRAMFMFTYRSAAYDLLEAMTNLRLLEKKKIEHKIKYSPINTFWWHKYGKEVLDNGFNKTGRGT